VEAYCAAWKKRSVGSWARRSVQDKKNETIGGRALCAKTNGTIGGFKQQRSIIFYYFSFFFKKKSEGRA
jgi:hypothetical protein